MLKKTLIAAAALSFIALGAASPASAHDRDWNGGKNWKNYGYNDYGYNDYRYIRKPDHRLLEVPALSLVAPVQLLATPLVLATERRGLPAPSRLPEVSPHARAE